MKKIFVCLIVISILIPSSFLFADELIEFKSGEKAKASEVNQNFETLKKEVDSLKNEIIALKSQINQCCKNLTYLISEDWENAQIDNSLWSILLTCNETPSVSSEDSESGSYSVSMIDHEGYNAAALQNTDSLGLSQGVIEFDFKEVYERTGGSVNFFVKNTDVRSENCNNENILFDLIVNSENKLYLRNVSTDNIKIGEVEFNKWNNIKIEFDLSKKTLSVNLNNQNIYNDVFNPKFSGEVEYIEFTTKSNFEDGPEYFLDNVIVASY